MLNNGLISNTSDYMFEEKTKKRSFSEGKKASKGVISGKEKTSRPKNRSKDFGKHGKSSPSKQEMRTSPLLSLEFTMGAIEEEYSFSSSLYSFNGASQINSNPYEKAHFTVSRHKLPTKTLQRRVQSAQNIQLLEEKSIQESKKKPKKQQWAMSGSSQESKKTRACSFEVNSIIKFLESQSRERKQSCL